LWATLLFLSVPAFVVMGGSFEADVPHVAFFLCGVASFVAAVDRRSVPGLALAAVFLACAALTVMQAQVAAPILLVYVWLFARNWVPAWVAACTPCATLIGWEVFERITSGVFPFALTAQYIGEQGWNKIATKLTSAAGLAMHFWFIVFAPLIVVGMIAAWRRRDRETGFLAAWIVLYFGAACALFIDGSARYLLPIAAPVAIWASYAKRSWLVAGFAVQMTISLCLAVENYQHWASYREFAFQISKQAGGRRVWVNSEWGLRHYMQDAGARVVYPGQRIPPGDIVVWSELVRPITVEHPGALEASVMQTEVRPSMPFRIIGLESPSGFSSISHGFAPFGIGDDLVDRIHADTYKEVKPTVSDLPMNAPEAETQIVSGIFGLEEGKQRWTTGNASVTLVNPKDAQPLHARFYVPDYAAAREVTILLDGRKVHSQAIAPGMLYIVTPPQKPAGEISIVSLQVDKTFSAPGDSRQLGVVLLGIGWGK
jgi:hypothetical protein